MTASSMLCFRSVSKLAWWISGALRRCPALALTGAQTLSFTSCPLGVFGKDTNLYIMVNNNARLTGRRAQEHVSRGRTETSRSPSPGPRRTRRSAVPRRASTKVSSTLKRMAQDSETTASNWGVKLQPTVANSIGDIDGTGASIDNNKPL